MFCVFFLRGKDGYIEGFLIVRGGDNYIWFDSNALRFLYPIQDNI